MFVLLAAAVVTGCMPSTGLLLKPVPLYEELDETVVSEDEGWLIRDKILILDIDGLLMNERSRSMFGADENPVSLFIEKLDKAANDDRVKAVILRLNSPGGGVTATDMMYHQLLAFRNKRKVPVVAIIEDVGASGAYYLACGADRILAHPTSVVGSIGVMAQTISIAGSMKMIGVEAKAVTSGPYKDMGSPLKPLDEKDLAVFQGIVDTYYERFLEVVTAGRPKIPADKLRKLADGRVFTGTDARANGLVDDLGYMDKAVALAKRLGRVGKVQVVMYHRPMGYRANVYSGRPAAPQINLINVSVPRLLDATRPRMLYLWTGRAPR